MFVHEGVGYSRARYFDQTRLETSFTTSESRKGLSEFRLLGFAQLAGGCLGHFLLFAFPWGNVEKGESGVGFIWAKTQRVVLSWLALDCSDEVFGNIAIGTTSFPTGCNKDSSL